jgi:hypothetical protein
LNLLSDIPTPVWAALSGGISGVGAWLVGMRRVDAQIESARVKLNADVRMEENAERAVFRATLMADIADLRRQVKECDSDRDILRVRVNTTEESILVLKASNQIMERWLAFFKDRNGWEVPVPSERPEVENST